jgi:ferredoxin
MIIDGRTVTFTQGQTILQAATTAGIAIPSLCTLEGIEPPTACFVCVVRIHGAKGVVPSCATAAREGIIVDSDSDEVRRYRRTALELLLSEHAGDCEAPCTRICPAGLDIPAMAGYIAMQDADRAAATVWDRLPLPGVLGHICPAPCEKGCRRAQADGAVSIRSLHKWVADTAFESSTVSLPTMAPASGKKVAIIGAGPAGLACAYYLRRHGHACVIIDERELPGGMLRYGIDRTTLPLSVLDREIGVIRDMGVEFRMQCRVGKQLPLDELTKTTDAVILAPGVPDAQATGLFHVTLSSKGIAIELGTWLTDRPGVFACGGATGAGRMAARAIGQGRSTAESVHHYLSSGTASCQPRQFDCHLGRLKPGEMEQFTAIDLSVCNGTQGPFAGTTVAAATRCLQCDCGKKTDCGLRSYAHAYGVNQDQYRSGTRKGVERKRFAGGLVHEPGKCISCGRCIGITDADRMQPGLSFHNRGFDVTVGTPFGADIDVAMGSSLDRCIAACPTGALWNRKRTGPTP